MDRTNKFLKNKASQIRESIISVCVKNNAGHIAPSLSTVDILVALYYEVLRFKQSDPCWPLRDRLVFSKGHGCYGLYAILADKKIIPDKQWKGFYTKASNLCGCLERNVKYGLEVGCGSLGHGLPMAVGIAFAAKLQKKNFRVFCLVGDGELQEGSNWEAFQFAVKHKLDNLIIIVDANRLQAMDFIVNVLDDNVNDILSRLKGFGLKTIACPGHDPAKIVSAIKAKSKRRVPLAIVAKTIKGYGLKCMENVPKFHFRIPTQKELEKG